MRNLSRADGFTLVEMMVSTAVVLMVLAGALTTFRNALAINDTATQLADSNQNLRAGTNQLVRDLLMAGRMIGSQGIAMPTGPGITYARPGPTMRNFDLVADGDTTVQLPSITTGFQLGPTINGAKTDIITIMTVDEFMPVLTTPPANPDAPNGAEGTISPDGTYVTLAAASEWIDGDLTRDTPKVKVGDLVLYAGQVGNAIQTVTSIDTALHRIYFQPGSPNDFFHFNQPNATNELAGTGRPLATVKRANTNPPTSIVWPANPALPVLCAAPGVVMTATSKFCAQVTLLKVLMITYYVDNTTTPGTPRLTRVLNHCPGTGTPDPTDPACAPFAPQALAGVVEDLHLTYDVYDGALNPTRLNELPVTLGNPPATYTDNQIRKVNIHVGVRSENKSPQTQDYVRNHMSTSVNIRSLAAVDKYPSQ